MQQTGRPLLRWAIFRVAAVLCLAGATVLPARALGEQSLKDMRHTVFRVKDGLPADSLQAIEQTTDGFLWLAGHGGVFRFDGMRFERLTLPRDPKLKSASASALCATGNGGLWIGFIFGGVGLYQAGKLRMYDAGDGLPTGSVRWIAEATDGTPWVVTSSGVASLDPAGRWQRVDVADARPGSIFAVRFDASGHVWASAIRDHLYRRARGATAFEHHAVPAHQLTEIISAPDGSAWIVDEQGFRRLPPSGSPVSTVAPHGNTGLVDDQGWLWVLDNRDLLRVNLKTAGDAVDLSKITDRFGPGDGLAWAGSPYRMLQTRDGQVWLLSSNTLERWSPRAVASYDLSFLTPAMGTDMGLGASPDGAIWLMPREGPLQSLGAGKASPVAGLVDVAAIARIADGTTWAGGPQDFWHLQQGRWTAVPRPPGTEGFDAQAFAGKGGDDVWVSIIRKGVFRRTGGAWRANGDLPGLPSEPAVTMAMDADGVLWLGYVDGRIARVQGSAVKMLGAADGLDIGVVTALVSRGGKVWAGGEFGLRQWNGNAFLPLLADRERAFDRITGIVEAASGDLWLSAAAGIVRVAAGDVARALGTTTPIVVDVFDRLDGYEGSSSRVRPLPTAVQAADGTLWFASSAGVFSIYPQASARSRPAPPVFIDRLAADNAATDLTSPVVLAKGTTAVQIDFIGLDLAVPERLRYRYRLEGVDADWRDAGPQRQALYANLDPGPYRFRVIASTDGRVWSPREAELGFRIAPTFVQTAWFAAICVAAAVAGVALVLRWRVRQLARRMRWKLDAQLAERDRIARELHDTLLQSTQGLILRFQAIVNRMPRDDPNRQKIETAIERADEVLTEGRHLIRGLRGSAGNLPSLVEALRTRADELSTEFHIPVNCRCSGEEPRLPLDTNDEMQRIVGEALVNACRHSGARSIDVIVTCRGDALEVVVDDDGVGIAVHAPSAASRPGHWGIRGMQERSGRIGARLSVSPRPGGGTRVSVTVPLDRGRRVS